MRSAHSHDQNFKNLIVDFVLDALRFFAAPEAGDLPEGTAVTPLRQEQQKDQLEEGHEETDAVFLVRPPRRQRMAFICLMEEETRPRDFSIERLGRYMLRLSQGNRETRIVPVVIFLGNGRAPRNLTLGTERATYLHLAYIACHLPRLNALDYVKSRNVVARILLPCMHIPDERRVEVVIEALEGVVTLVRNRHLQRKYADFVAMYGRLSETEDVELERRVKQRPWGRSMMGWFGKAEAKGEARGLAKGEARGLAKGRADKARALVLRALQKRQVRLTSADKKRIASCTDLDKLDRWFDRALVATTVGQVFRAPAARKKPAARKLQ
jgi:hypothetical protein